MRRLPALAALCLLAVAGCATPSQSKRSERAASEVDDALREAERRMRALDVTGAEDALEDAKDGLANPDVKLHPEGTLLERRYGELLEQLERTRKEKAARELALAVEEQRQRLERARTRLLEATDAVDRPELTPGRISELRSAMEAVAKELEQGKAYEAQSASYADDAGHARRRIERAKARSALAERRLAFTDGPARAHARGGELLASVKQEKDLQRRQQLLAEARRELQACRDQGGAQLKADQELPAAAIVSGGGKSTTPAQVLKECEQRLKTAEKLLKAVEKQLRKRSKRAGKQRTR